MVFAALAALGLAIGTNPGAVAFLAMPWLWVPRLAMHLHRLETLRLRDSSEDTRTDDRSGVTPQRSSTTSMRTGLPSVPSDFFVPQPLSTSLPSG